jgi:hypothetical protein
MIFLAYEVQNKGIFPLSRYHVSFLRGRGKSNCVLSLKTCNLFLICVLKTLLRPGQAGRRSQTAAVGRPAVNRYKWLVSEAADGWVQELNCTTSCDFVKREFARRILRLDLSLSVCLKQEGALVRETVWRPWTKWSTFEESRSCPW